ncbi:MAG TPA: phosphoribosylamine--glycine ligase [Gemmatimonadaceae bacterium]|nr:phosphoribosylamine--glycine ligase [Gemmatimonadaceae bacterium]
MKLLIVGGGGREHALAWKLLRDDPSIELIAAPGNPGIAEIGRCVAVSATDIPALVELARAERVELTVVGPEAPLAAGIVDRFRAARLPIFGPTAGAAAIEASKTFAKRIMVEAGVPTARAERHTDAAPARRAARELGAPVVIKASGLAAGKGAVVCATLEEADAAIDLMLRDRAFGDAGTEILVEEFMEGEELSLFALTDGHDVLPMLPAQDHKRLLEGDRGPNTGGMGAYAPVSIGDDALVATAVDRIFHPTLAALRDAGHPFTGLLYAGLMLTADGPRVVEFNARFGDPETEAILPLLDSSLLDVLRSVAVGDGLGTRRLEWRDAMAVTTVVAAAGYPDAPRKGDRIVLPPAADDVHIFHAGTARAADGSLVTAGGRVLAITAVRETLADAQRASADAAARVSFEGKQLRRDIGWRELRRVGAGATRD